MTGWTETVSSVDDAIASRRDLFGPRPDVFHDWRGTAALQENIADGPQLEALAGLDRNEWQVVGVTIEMGRGDERGGQVYLYAFNKSGIDLAGPYGEFEQVKNFAQQYRSIPVTRFRLVGVTMQDILSHMTAVHFQFQASGLGDVSFHVTGYEDSITD